MIRRLGSALAFSLMCFCLPAVAIPVAVANHGFELPSTGGFTVGSFTGWTATGSGAGVWNINSSPLGFWTAPAPGGNQVAFVGREDPAGTPAALSQILGSTLLDRTLYTLSGWVGHPLGFGGTASPATTYTVELLAGTTVLQSISGTGPEGTFTPFQLNFDSTGSAFVGQALQIRLASSKTQTAFDDIQLDRRASLPEPTTAALLALGLAGGTLLRRRTPQERART